MQNPVFNPPGGASLNNLGSISDFIAHDTNTANSLAPETSLANLESGGVDGSGVLEQTDLFFRFLALSSLDATKSYPYEMWIKDVKTGQLISRFIFPLNPQSIQINVPSATVLEATMKGIYETHNGAPFRQISIVGTTGVIPTPPMAPAQAQEGDLQKAAEYAFQNTINAASTLVNQVSRTIKAFSGATQSFTGPLNYTYGDLDQNLYTGYESINDLSRFLDYYLAGKKLSQNKGWRLYLIMNKDKAYYACSLQGYNIVKSQGTVEYQYNINLTAYRREKDKPVPAVTPDNNVKSRINAANTANILSNIINGITQARRTIADANNVLSGIRNDIYTSFIAPVNQLVLLTKDLTGLATNVFDFAHSIQLLASMKEPIKSYYTANASTNPTVAAALKATFTQLGLVGSLNSNGQAISAIETSSQTKLSSGQADYFVDSADSADPFNVVFQNPANYPAFFEALPIEDLDLPVAVTDQINNMTSQALQLTANDIVNMRNTVIDFNTSISSALGGANQTWNNIKGLGPVPTNYQPLTVDSIILLSNLNDICIQMDSLIAQLDRAENNSSQDYYQFYSAYAVAQGVLFNANNLSRFFVPFPRNGSLEMLATQYLGAPERWIEIAALNALKQPYIDETGYTIPVTASPGPDTLFVANAGYMYVGQVVSVYSNNVAASLHQISGIEVVSVNQTILTFVDVPTSPLTQYTVAQGATINAYMPNTVNSNMLIAIPSTANPSFPTTMRTSPEIQELNAIARMAKIDFMLDMNGDLIFTGGGDIVLAYGMTNLVQAAMMKLQTKTQQIINLPGYGNPVDAGVSSADVTAQQILTAINTSFKQDPRFSGILAGEVAMQGPTVTISILVGIANMQVSLPVQAELPR
jgi:hypothetical protein